MDMEFSDLRIVFLWLLRPEVTCHVESFLKWKSKASSPKCGPWAGNVNLTWEFVWSADPTLDLLALPWAISPGDFCAWSSPPSPSIWSSPFLFLSYLLNISTWAPVTFHPTHSIWNQCAFEQDFEMKNPCFLSVFVYASSEGAGSLLVGASKPVFYSGGIMWHIGSCPVSTTPLFFSKCLHIFILIFPLLRAGLSLSPWAHLSLPSY